MLESDALLPVLKRLRIAPLQWIGRPRPLSGEMTSRLYILHRDMKVCITFFYCENSRVEVSELAAPGREVARWLRRYVGVLPLDVPTAKRIVDRLRELCGRARLDCVTNSRDGILAFHVVVTEAEEYCVKMLNPQNHDNHAYKNIVSLYSEEFLGGNVRL